MSETRKNLPNIPLYIGDWEKDCNVLSLETEAAWLRIIFKMFTRGKQSAYKIPTKGLQNLWRVSEEKVQDILSELIDYNICDIVVDGRFIEFTCRRYLKESYISEVRKGAVSQRKDRTNNKQNTYKNDTKSLQNAENDNDNVIVNNNKRNENLLFSDLEKLFTGNKYLEMGDDFIKKYDEKDFDRYSKFLTFFEPYRKIIFHHDFVTIKYFKEKIMEYPDATIKKAVLKMMGLGIKKDMMLSARLLDAIGWVTEGKEKVKSKDPNFKFDEA